MDYSIFIWEIIAFVLISLISSVIYLYCDYQDSNNFYKLFIPKNDSLWERVKVLLAPTILVMLIECLFIDINSNFEEKIAIKIMDKYEKYYEELKTNRNVVLEVLKSEKMGRRRKFEEKKDFFICRDFDDGIDGMYAGRRFG